MAFENFKPNVWSASIELELERLCVFAEDCNRKYEGEVKHKGDSVTILGVGKPTIKDLAKSSNADIDAPEVIEDTSVTMNINQVCYFNYMVGDLDKAQAQDGIMDALNEETSEGIANKMDSFIAKFAMDSNVHRMNNTPLKVVASETANEGEIYVLDLLDNAYTWLKEHDVKGSTEVVATVSPKFAQILRKAYRLECTDNKDIMKNGTIGMYGKIKIKESNNTAKDGEVDHLMMRTKRAIAFVNPFTHTEPYRPESKFADAVKGYSLYDGKIVRPKEMVDMNVTY